MLAKRQPGVLLVGLAYLGFVSIGLPDGLLGVAWPSMRASFGLPLDALGALLVMFTTGYLLSSFSSGRLLAHINVGSLLALSCLGTAASLLGYALALYEVLMTTSGKRLHRVEATVTAPGLRPSLMAQPPRHRGLI